MLSSSIENSLPRNIQNISWVQIREHLQLWSITVKEKMRFLGCMWSFLFTCQPWCSFIFQPFLWKPSPILFYSLKICLDVVLLDSCPVSHKKNCLDSRFVELQIFRFQGWAHAVLSICMYIMLWSDGSSLQIPKVRGSFLTGRVNTFGDIGSLILNTYKWLFFKTVTV